MEGREIMNYLNRKGIGLLVAVTLVAVGATGCEELLSTIGTDGSSEYVYWITASEDTYASCGRTAGCEEGDLNFGRHGFLAVAAGQLGTKRAYLDFVLPSFPEGTTVEYAKIELFKPGKNEDGAGDDMRLAIGTVRSGDWSESTLTWNDRPDPGASAGAGEFELKLRPQDWSPSTNFFHLMQQIVDDPSTFNGFVISVAPQFFGQQIEKGFNSTNYFGRAGDDLDRAPRLLLKVTLPQGSPSPATFLPTGLIGGLGSASVAWRYQAGTEFPANWDVSPE